MTVLRGPRSGVTFGERVARLSLAARFAVTGGIVMLAAMIAIGSWVTAQISDGVVASTASATALFMDSFIAPLAQELDESNQLSIGPIRALDEMLSGSNMLGSRVVAIKIWKRDGLIAYSNKSELIGKSFPLNHGVEKAFSGRVFAELDELDDPESSLEKASGLPLLEIYSPIRRPWSGDIIAVVEFYENASELSRDLDRARLKSWSVVAAVTLFIGLALFGVVQRGSSTIRHQRDELEQRMRESERLSAQNTVLRHRVERAASRLTELNEHFLRRIGADLHDGPAQLVSFALLRLASVAGGKTADTRRRDAVAVTAALTEAISEIRNICVGLSLPEIEHMSVGDAVNFVIGRHEQRTDTSVSRSLEITDVLLAHAKTICIFRFVQEGLNNAFRHAQGIGQRVWLRRDGNSIEVGVASLIQDGAPEAPKPAGTGLGLAGLRERIESIGGFFAVAAEDGEMIIRMSVSITGDEPNA